MRIEYKHITNLIEVVPLPGGETRPLWIDRNTPGDGRDYEALQAFRQVMAVSPVSQS